MLSRQANLHRRKQYQKLSEPLNTSTSMGETDKKSKLIAQIFKLTKGDTKYFDKLADKSEQYLEKYVKVVKGLK